MKLSLIKKFFSRKKTADVTPKKKKTKPAKKTKEIISGDQTHDVIFAESRAEKENPIKAEPINEPADNNPPPKKHTARDSPHPTYLYFP